jgi:uncharacterized repeat protein (TIGR02543 family)
VSEATGWIDPTQSANDCWAYTTASLIWWWQEQLKAQGYTLPEGVPTEVRAIHTAVRATNPAYGDNSGGWVQVALKNYLAKYFPMVANQAVTEAGKVTHTQYWGGLYSAEEQSAWIRKQLEAGLAIAMTDTQGHDTGSGAHTSMIWGADFDSNGLVTGFYYTDSSYTADNNKLEYAKCIKFTCLNGDNCSRHSTNPTNTTLKFGKYDKYNTSVSYSIQYYFNMGEVLTFDLRDSAGNKLDKNLKSVEGTAPETTPDSGTTTPDNSGSGNTTTPDNSGSGNTTTPDNGSSTTPSTPETSTPDTTTPDTSTPEVTPSTPETTPSTPETAPDSGTTTLPDATPEVVTTYTVSYDANGGSGNLPEPQTAEKGQSVQVASTTLTRENYTFAGWSTTKGGSVAHKPGATLTPTANTALYAVWEAIPTYTLRYDANGGTGTVPVASTLYNTQFFQVAAASGLTRENYTFAGWNTQADGKGTTYAVGASFAATKDMTLYAMWTENATYTVSYNANGGTGEVPAIQTGYAAEKIVVADGSTLTKAGYTFDSWKTGTSSKATSYDPGDELTLGTSNVTLYAQWKAVEVTPDPDPEPDPEPETPTPSPEPETPAPEPDPEPEPETPAPSAPEATTASVSYTTHVQNVGWQASVSNGALAGTSNRGLRLEALKVSVSSNVEGSIEYRTHVENIGWQAWSSNGSLAGTNGQGLRLEALQVRLTGELAEKYDVYYRVHAQNYGWLGWTKNGLPSGTAGHGLRLEAMEIKLVEKGAAAPTSSTDAFVGGVSAQSHVQNIGWQDWATTPNATGTSGQGLRLEAMRLKLSGLPYAGSITYRTHVQNIGWQSYVSNGSLAGTSGQGLRLEAIQIKLEGEIAQYYDVYYRVHAENFGWLGWAKNGEQSGTAGFGYRLESLEVQLVEKGAAAPGSTARTFVQKA